MVTLRTLLLEQFEPTARRLPSGEDASAVPDRAPRFRPNAQTDDFKAYTGFPPMIRRLAQLQISVLCSVSAPERVRHWRIDVLR